MKTIIKIECPYCLGNIEVNQGDEFVKCKYCGKTTFVGSSDFVYKKIDVAEINKVEADRDVKFKKIEIEMHKNKFSTIIKIGVFVVAVIFAIISISGLSKDPESLGSFVMFFFAFTCFILFLVLIINGSNSKIDNEDPYYITVKQGNEEFKEKNYREAEANLKALGFSDVETIPLNDLGLIGSKIINEWVSDVTINGKPVEANHKYPKDSKVVISYHSKKQK